MNFAKIGFFVIICCTFTRAQQGLFSIENSEINTDNPSAEDSSSVNISHGNKGWEISSSDGNYKIQIDSRIQFRYSYPLDSDPVTYDAFTKPEKHSFEVNRSRLKVGGNAFRKWFQYYFEYELGRGKLLDFRIVVTKFPFLNLKVGQFKAHFNRERLISSGKQQLVDRSLIKHVFAIDRQIGISLYGRLQFGGVADFNYWASILTGTGRGAASNDDKHLMWLARLQWNFLGEPIEFCGSDLEYFENPSALLAIAGVTNRSPYTRFSGSGGGQLEGFEDGVDGQYRLNQLMLETAFKFRGFSWQQELHWKQVRDLLNVQYTTLVGNYVQFGCVLNYWIEFIPEQLELAVRHSIFNPERGMDSDIVQEYTIGMNWFFNGHRNKLSTEYSHFHYQENDYCDSRFRLQWDFSL